MLTEQNRSSVFSHVNCKTKCILINQSVERKTKTRPVYVVFTFENSEIAALPNIRLFSDTL